MGAESFPVDRRIDLTKLIVAFRNFTNASKKGLFSTVDERGYFWAAESYEYMRNNRDPSYAIC